jgi:hypothetical protein
MRVIMLVTELEIKDKGKSRQVTCHWRKMCRCTAPYILNHYARRGSVTNCMAWPLYLLKQNWRPLYLRTYRPRDRSRRQQQMPLPPPYFEPRAIHPLPVRCAYYATLVAGFEVTGTFLNLW